jgi:TonB family protein
VGQEAAASDGEKLVLEAAQRNGFTGAVAPYHLVLSYSLLDKSGNVTERGSYESFWVSEKKFKRVYAGGGTPFVMFSTEAGVVHTGDRPFPPQQVMFLGRDFEQPLPITKIPDMLEAILQPAGADSGDQECVAIRVKAKAGMIPGRGTMYCFEAGSHALRAAIFSPKVHEDRFEGSVPFEGRLLPSDVKIMQAGYVNATAHLEKIEPLTVREADFVPPADAVAAPQRGERIPVAGGGGPGPSGVGSAGGGPTPSSNSAKRIAISAGVAQAMLSKKLVPVYPADAKAAGVSGTVVLQAMIDATGAVKELQVISGPQMLQQAALDAVQRWVYRPYLLNGEPVEVVTTVNVVFALGK